MQNRFFLFFNHIYSAIDQARLSPYHSSLNDIKASLTSSNTTSKTLSKTVLTLKEMALNVLIKQGLWNIGVALPEDASTFFQDSISLVLEQIINDSIQDVMPVFFQAVIDEDILIITKLLDQYPWLLLSKAPKGLVVKSQLTWQQFDLEGENILSIIIKLKKIVMLYQLYPYIKKLNQEDLLEAKNILLKWPNPIPAYRPKFYIDHGDYYGDWIEAMCKFVMYDSALMPDKYYEYTRYAESLIQLFSSEPIQNPNRVNVSPYQLSPSLEGELNKLLDLLCPAKIIKLEEHVDVELLLCAMNNVFLNKAFDYGDLTKWQADAVSVRVIGLIQAFLPPETAKFFCHGLRGVLTELESGKKPHEIILSDLAKQYKLKNGLQFYRVSRDAKYGLGNQFFCCANDAIASSRNKYIEDQRYRVAPWVFGGYLREKQYFFDEICSNYHLSQVSNPVKLLKN